jgi:hypothetical protein
MEMKQVSEASDGTIILDGDSQEVRPGEVKLWKLVRYVTIIHDGSSLKMGKMGTLEVKLVSPVTSL